MNKRVLTVIENGALAPSTLISPDERQEPVSLNGGDCLSKPETRRSAALCWFIDTLALAGAAMAGVYVSDWLDPSKISGNRTDGKDETSPEQRGVAAARHDADGWPF
jgi:hypothetical protein